VSGGAEFARPRKGTDKVSAIGIVEVGRRGVTCHRDYCVVYCVLDEMYVGDFLSEVIGGLAAQWRLETAKENEFA
jgi:hypothetical protein